MICDADHMFLTMIRQRFELVNQQFWGFNKLLDFVTRQFLCKDEYGTTIETKGNTNFGKERFF